MSDLVLLPMISARFESVRSVKSGVPFPNRRV
jgi:hypothetical protein